MNITNSQIHIGAVYIYSGPQGYIVQGGPIGPTGTVGPDMPLQVCPSGPVGQSGPVGPSGTVVTQTTDVSGNIVIGDSGGTR